MKKNIISILLCLGCVSVFTQTRVVPKAGVSISNYRYGSGANSNLDEFYDPGIVIGALFGVGVEIPLAGGLSLQPEILFVQKGSSQESEIFEPYIDEEIDGQRIVVYDNIDESLNYLEVPLLLKYEFLGGSYGFHILGGPVISFGLSGKEEITLTDEFGTILNDQLPDFDFDFDLDFGSTSSDTYQGLDFGAAIGAGMYFELGSGRLLIDLRYVLGLANMYDDEFRFKGFVELQGEEQFNSSLQFSLGYAIPVSP